jgi:hypothetical protein
VSLIVEATGELNPIRRRIILRRAARKLEEEIRANGYPTPSGESRGAALIVAYEGLNKTKLELALIENILATESKDSCLYNLASGMYPLVKEKSEWPFYKRYLRTQSQKMRMITWWAEGIIVGKGYSRI